MLLLLYNLYIDILNGFSKQEAFMRLSTRSPKDSAHLFEEAATIMSNDIDYWNETGTLVVYVWIMYVWIMLYDIIFSLFAEEIPL